jgi:hypothetical protein
MVDPSPKADDGFRLTPKHAPGRSSRKARAYAAEIARLHGLGYSLDAIREALADAGVSVSRTTVHREAVRLRATPTAAASDSVAPTDPALTRLLAGGKELINSLIRSKAQR